MVARPAAKIVPPINCSLIKIAKIGIINPKPVTNNTSEIIKSLMVRFICTKTYYSFINLYDASHKHFYNCGLLPSVMSEDRALSLSGDTAESLDGRLEPQQQNPEARSYCEELITRHKELSTLMAQEDSWSSVPLHYLVMAATRPEFSGMHAYLKPTVMRITAKQARALNKLVESDGMHGTLRNYAAIEHMHISADELESILAKVRQELRARDKHARVFGAQPRKTTSDAQRLTEIGVDIKESSGPLVDLAEEAFDILDLVCKEPHSSYQGMLTRLKDVQQRLEQEFIRTKYQDRNVVDFRRVLQQNLDSYKGTELRMMQGLLFLNRLPREDMLNEQLQLKIKRTDALLDMDKNLALAYFAFTPCIFIWLNTAQKGTGLPLESTEEIFDAPMMRDYIERDRELYQGILNAFEVEPEKKPAPKPVPVMPKPAPVREPTPCERLAHAIMAKDNGYMLTDDMAARLRYFAEDVVHLGLGKDQFAALCANFSGLHLARRMRKHETRLKSELHFRTFFDDIYLSVYQRKIPEKKVLDAYYRRQFRLANPKTETAPSGNP